MGDAQGILQWSLGSSMFSLVFWMGREKAVSTPLPQMLLDALEPREMQVLSKPREHLEALLCLALSSFSPWVASLLIEDIDRRAGQLIWKKNSYP